MKTSVLPEPASIQIAVGCPECSTYCTCFSMIVDSVEIIEDNKDSHLYRVKLGCLNCGYKETVRIEIRR